MISATSDVRQAWLFATFSLVVPSKDRHFLEEILKDLRSITSERPLGGFLCVDVGIATTDPGFRFVIWLSQQPEVSVSRFCTGECSNASIRGVT